MSEVTTYAGIQSLVTMIMDTAQGFPKNASLQVELDQESFIKLQDEMHSPLMTPPSKWNRESFSIATTYGVKIHIIRKIE